MIEGNDTQSASILLTGYEFLHSADETRISIGQAPISGPLMRITSELNAISKSTGETINTLGTCRCINLMGSSL